MRKFTLIAAVLFMVNGVNAEPYDTRGTLNQFLALYQQRTDFEQFMSLYADNARLVDVTYGFEANGKEKIRAFFDWPNNTVTPVNGNSVLSTDAIIVKDNKAIIKGIFHRFEYRQKHRGPWRFITILHFNQNGKINYHEDWINYTPRSMMNGPYDFNGEELQR